MDEYITTTCAWCGLYLRGPQPDTDPVSHGICPDCTDRALDLIGQEIERLPD